MRTRLWVVGISLLLLMYCGLVLQRALVLLLEQEIGAKILGGALLMFPIFGLWSLAHELRFGCRAEHLAQILATQGKLPQNHRRRASNGRADREAMQEALSRYRATVEANPEAWDAWFSLSYACAAGGTRKEAREAMRRAIQLQKSSPSTENVDTEEMLGIVQKNTGARSAQTSSMGTGRH